jgi:rSAM/selenodomain-associated transferase 1
VNTALLIFTKAAEPGLTKTRLIPGLGAVRAAAAHETLSERVFRAVVGSQLSIVLWGASAHPSLARWAEQYGWPLRRQRGDDLGQRMFHALASALADGADRAILIGTDCPLMSAAYVAQAEAALDTADVVVGPAEDGGYVLIGLKRAEPALFRGIDWGTDQVLEQTLGAASQAHCSIAMLATLWDVDRPEDWQRFLALDPRKQEVNER